ncbi:hypothetical protein ACFQJC_09435 [Haloferax namakaokahaiae]|uniref:ABC transporter permease n=1 Tax=Haloferax namakaokahaiae TaxID=1748331 RepID=A0ABD5ZEL3_9EURY
MFGIETLTGSTQAVALVGLVLVEAMLLYVGYGALTRALSPTIHNLIGDE